MRKVCISAANSDPIILVKFSTKDSRGKICKDEVRKSQSKLPKWKKEMQSSDGFRIISEKEV
jgi:hypothetical protein